MTTEALRFLQSNVIGYDSVLFISVTQTLFVDVGYCKPSGEKYGDTPVVKDVVNNFQEKQSTTESRIEGNTILSSFGDQEVLPYRVIFFIYFIHYRKIIT